VTQRSLIAFVTYLCEAGFEAIAPRKIFAWPENPRGDSFESGYARFIHLKFMLYTPVGRLNFKIKLPLWLFTVVPFR
jgi:hypothetical protein